MQIESIYQIPLAYSHIFSENSTISRQSSRIICSLINETYNKISWIRFSESCRYIYANGRPLLASDLQQLEIFPDEESTHLLGIASMNASGYVRESAMLALEKLSNPHSIPYLLMRLNDWVPNIRKKALSICEHKIQVFHPIDWLKYYFLIQWLGKASRTCFSMFQQKLIQYIIQEKFRREIIEYLRVNQVKANLFYWKNLSSELLTSDELIDELLSNKYPEVRVLGVKYFTVSENYDKYFNILCADKSSRVRYAAIKSISAAQMPIYQSLFEQMLLDISEKIREYSRFVLKSLNIHDFKVIYLRHIKTDLQSKRLGIFLGWLEVAQAEDVQEIENLTLHQSSKVRLGAYKALSRVTLSKIPINYLSGLTDSNGKVRKYCAQIPVDMANDIQEEITILLKDDRPEIKRLVITIMLGLKTRYTQKLCMLHQAAFLSSKSW